jgi:serine/threonine protein kinase
VNELSNDRLRHLRDLIDRPDLTGTKFELVKKIAVGGMGTVFLVRDNDLSRNIALKVLSAPDPGGTLAARMTREAKIVAQLEHPGIVPIHDVGRLADDRVFYTMKFVEGETLEEHRRRHASPISDQLRIFQKVCEAVEFAHARGVLHRDLKPANIMVGAFGEVLVMDWGIATRLQVKSAGEIADAADSRADLNGATTAHGTILGTPAYMSPEQAQGHSDAIDQRTDIYGLGGILYFLLTEQQPFSGDSAETILRDVIAGRLRHPREIENSIPRRLEAICLKAMATDPGGRYHSARALAADVAQFLDGEPVGAYRENILERVGRWLTRNRFIVFIIVAYILVRVIIFFWRGF